MTPLDHLQIPVTGTVADSAGARNPAAVKETVFYKGVRAAVDPTLDCSTTIVPEVVVAAVAAAAAAEVTQVAAMYPVVTPRHLLQVFKTRFLSREFSGRCREILEATVPAVRRRTLQTLTLVGEVMLVNVM
jgi:hypothetical protein